MPLVVSPDARRADLRRDARASAWRPRPGRSAGSPRSTRRSCSGAESIDRSARERASRRWRSWRPRTSARRIAMPAEVRRRAQGGQPRARARRDRGAGRALGLGQDDLPEHPRLPAHPDLRPGGDRRRRRSTRAVPTCSGGYRRDSIGFVFQQFNLFPSLTAAENVEYALNIKGRTRPAARGEAARWLDAVGLADRIELPAARPLRRPEAAGGDRPGPGRRGADHPGRRADREPRPPGRRADPRPVPRPGPARGPGAADRDPRPEGPADRRPRRGHPRRPSSERQGA